MAELQDCCQCQRFDYEWMSRHEIVSQSEELSCHEIVNQSEELNCREIVNPTDGSIHHVIVISQSVVHMMILIEILRAHGCDNFLSLVLDIFLLAREWCS